MSNILSTQILLLNYFKKWILKTIILLKLVVMSE